MGRKIVVSLVGLLGGILIGYLLVNYAPATEQAILRGVGIQKKTVIGFLPYWLIGKAGGDYSKYITDLTYFGLTVDTDGKILKLNNPQEEEPGWSALKSGKLTDVFSQAKKQNLELSLLVFNGNHDSIYSLIDAPKTHADNLVSDISPIMKQYDFKDLNLDIEDTQEASSEARLKFTEFTQEVKSDLQKNNLGTLTLDVSPDALIKNYLIDSKAVAPIADRIVLMTYDYHYTGSQVTGPVSPISGAGVTSEYDTNAALQRAMQIIPNQKILLGAPLYGYEWETIENTPRSAVIPGTGLIASNFRVEQLLSSCATCSAQYDKTSRESYLIYKDTSTGTFHQIFFPDKNSTISKIDLAQTYQLGGVALWALGYEGKDILGPLQSYK